MLLLQALTNLTACLVKGQQESALQHRQVMEALAGTSAPTSTLLPALAANLAAPALGATARSPPPVPHQAASSATLAPIFPTADSALTTGLQEALAALLPTAPDDGSHVVLADRARISSRIAQAALNGEFVNLCDFLPSDPSPEAPMEASVAGGYLTFAPRKSRKSIDSIERWLLAWANLETFLGEHTPALYGRLAIHRRHITEASRRFIWPAVTSYDHQFRLGLSRTKSFEYSQLDSSLYASCLNSTQARTNVASCFRCRSTDHVIAECPFQASASVEARKAPAQGSQAAKAPSAALGAAPGRRAQTTAYHNDKAVCNNYNRGHCNWGNCRREHVCLACSGRHPVMQCPTAATANSN
ncbi:MAG: hypothetical protein V3S01_09055 [Dehalococcoidia bacterium]